MKPLLEIEYQDNTNTMTKFLMWIRGMLINLLTWPFIECGVGEKIPSTPIYCEYCGNRIFVSYGTLNVCDSCRRKVFDKVLKRKKAKK